VADQHSTSAAQSTCPARTAPGRFAGDTTTMHVTYYNANKPNDEVFVFEQLTLHRKRSDTRH
jgi:hypothetical protein